mmetsp:Transcript_20459/g.38481  ORF Transcript_20459/g.38481 Transcript_20459/m.38481 type:complete len:270 (+) Transcript_20459:749-1558(+)
MRRPLTRNFITFTAPECAAVCRAVFLSGFAGSNPGLHPSRYLTSSSLSARTAAKRPASNTSRPASCFPLLPKSLFTVSESLRATASVIAYLGSTCDLRWKYRRVCLQEALAFARAFFTHARDFPMSHTSFTRASSSPGETACIFSCFQSGLQKTTRGGACGDAESSFSALFFAIFVRRTTTWLLFLVSLSFAASGAYARVNTSTLSTIMTSPSSSACFSCCSRVRTGSSYFGTISRKSQWQSILVASSTVLVAHVVVVPLLLFTVSSSR